MVLGVEQLRDRSAVRPKKSSTPNHRLAPHGGEVSTSSDPSEDKISSGSPLGSPEGSSPEQKAPTVFIRSRDEENPSGPKPMPTFDPSDLIGRTFLLPPDRIPSTTPGAEPPRDAKDSGSARSHPTHLETSSSNRP